MSELTTPRMEMPEVIDTLKGLVFGTFDRTTKKEREALNEAISLLENPCEDAISRKHFDERVRLAGGMADEELTQDFKDGILTVLEMLKTEPFINPTQSNAQDCIDRQAALLPYAELRDDDVISVRTIRQNLECLYKSL